MTLTTRQMGQLADAAREMATPQCRTYLADAAQCLRHTGDPIAALDLLCAMWSSGHAARPNQKTALDAAGQWLDDRLRREPGLAADQLELELGWLHRLITIHAPGNRPERGSAPPRDLTFGLQRDALRRRRDQVLRRATGADEQDLARAEIPKRSGPAQLPSSFESCFADWEDAADAFRNARKRRKQGKLPRDRPLPVKAVQANLQHLATDLVCSLLRTQGMAELEDRALAGSGTLPSFWISVADLVEQDGRRLITRISLDPT